MEDRSQVAAIIEELKRLDGQIDSVPDLVALKPIFYRIEEINKEHPTDFEVQLLISDVKQHLVNRGTLLKQQPGGAARTVSGTAAVPAQQAGVATKSDPSIWAATASTPAVPSSVPELPLGAGAPPFPPVTPHVGEKPSGEREVYIPPARTQPPPPQPAAPAMNWKKPVWIGVSVGLILGLAVLGTLILKKRPKPEPPVTVTLVPLEITTIPAGATIRVDGQTCTSNCKVDLKPGQYKLMAELPGYLQDFRDITAAAGQPIVLNLTLAPQPQGLRIITDFGTHGQVLLDDKPAGALQDGQLTLDSVPAGKHSIRITGRPGQEAKFDFEVKPGAAAVMDGPVTAKNVVAVVANRFGKQIHLQANQNPLKVSLDGAPKGETTADGIDIGDVPEGDRELTLNDGKTPDRKLVVPASASPVMAVWVNADTSTGTLVVNTGEDGVTVLIDGKPQSRKTRRGQLVITSLQPKDYKIKVTKAGFQDVPEQNATIKGGTQTPLNFTLKAVPTVAVLHVKGGTAGADVFVDKEHVGIIENDGSFQYPNVAPGEHTIEIKKEGFMTKTHRLLFAEGQTMELPAEAVTLQPANGSVKITVAPENAQITVKYPDGRTQRMQPGTHPLPVGSYTISATAPGFRENSKSVQVNSGEVAPVDLRLTRETAQVARPVASKADWERPDDWKPESGWMVHKGAGFVPFGAQPSTGVYTFSAQVMKGGLLGGKRVQWYVGYVDNKNYTQCQLDKKSFQCFVVTNGKRASKPKKELNTDEPFTVQIDVASDSVTHKLREADKWITLDTLTVPNVGSGKFGFLVQGNDALAISNFVYTAK